jgi:hypothetical protein
MTGQIRQRSKGSWQIRWDGPSGADGKRQQRTETVRGSKKEAQARLREVLRSMKVSPLLPRSSTSLMLNILIPMVTEWSRETVRRGLTRGE